MSYLRSETHRHAFHGAMILKAVVFSVIFVVHPVLAQGESGGLFSPVDDPVEVRTTDLHEETVRSRQVRVDFDYLSDPATRAPRETIKLEVFPDTSLTVHLETTRETYTGWAWIGRVEDAPLSSVTLMVSDHGDRPRLTGSVSGLVDQLPGGHGLRISATSEPGIHTITELDLNRLPQCAVSSGEPRLTHEIEGGMLGGLSTSQIRDYEQQSRSQTTIDILVVYTPAARQLAGSASNVEDAITTTVTESNTALSNSGVDAELNLVHVAEVTYSESGDMGDDLEALTDPFGTLSQVHQLRNEHAADLVAMITGQSSGSCGIAWVPSSADFANSRLGMSITRFGCLAPALTFAHEIGHNLGSAHDWYVAEGPGTFKHSHGHVRTDEDWYTIMSYRNKCEADGKFFCDRIPHFANPIVSHNGEATGVPIGTDLTCETGDLGNPECDAHVQDTFRIMAPVIADYRTSSLPSNTTFDTAHVLSGSYGSLIGTNRDAGREDGEPLHHDENGGGHSVWYRWTPDETAWVFMRLEGNDYPAMMAIYAGDSLEDLAGNKINSIENSTGERESIGFTATAGTTYHIAVDGVDSETGFHIVNWYQLLLHGNGNSRFSDRESISGTEGSISATNQGAWAEPNEPEHAGQHSGLARSVWYEWTAPESVAMQFDTFGSDLDTILAVYTGGSIGSLTEVASNDDYINRLESRVDFEAEQGVTYKIAIDGFRLNTGNFTLNWSTPIQLHELSVNSSGASNVEIDSATGHGGTTNYSLAIADGTTVELSAPAEWNGRDFDSWSGCDSTAGTDCTIDEMNANVTVTANYVAPEYTLTVESQGASNVSISSSTGHGGTTNYSRTVSDATDIELTAPATANGMEFSHWSGCDSTSMRDCVINSIDSDMTVVVTYEPIDEDPAISVSPSAMSFQVDPGDADTRSLSIENTGGGELEWSIETSRPEGNSASLTVSERLFSPLSPIEIGVERLEPDALVNIDREGGFNCDNAPGMIINDDGSADTFFGYNAADVSEASFVEGFEVSNAGKLGSVCLAWWTGTDQTFEFDLVVYQSDGSGNVPNTELLSVAMSIDLVEGANWYVADLGPLNFEVESGLVYVGFRYQPPEDAVAIGADESGDGNAVSYVQTDGSNWGRLDEFGSDDHKALLIRAQVLPTGCENPSEIDWLNVSPTSGQTSAASTSQVDVAVDSTGLQDGIYEAVLCIESNDLNNPVVEVPVSLEVDGDTVYRDRFEQ